MLKKLIITTFIVSLPFISIAGGYQVNLIGVRYIGMGHIGTSLALDAGTIFFNPGNLGFLRDTFNITGSASGIFSYTSFRKAFPSTYKAESDNPIAPPFSAFASYKFNEKISAGIGVYTPFGSSVHWDDDWAGRYLIQKISLKTVLIQPTISYKINDKLGIGIGAVFAYGKVDLKRALPITDVNGNEGQVHLKGHATNWGFNAGLAYHPTEDLSIGLSYRSKIDMKVKDGDATFTVPLSLSSSFPTGNTFNASVPLPANWNFGISYNFSEKLMIGADVNFVQWDAYDSLIFDFKNNTTALEDSRNPRKYKNTFIYRLGGQYKCSDKFFVRAGAYFDNSPVNNQYFSPETPDANRLGLSVGLSFFPTKKLSIDASFLFIDEMKRNANYVTENFGGTYKSYAYIPGLGLTYSF